MKTTSETGRCIGCDSADVQMESMSCMGEDAEFPICDACAPYLEPVFTDPSLGPGFITFIGVTDIQRPRQSGGAFSFSVKDGGLPADFADRMQNLDLYCEYLGKRIQARRTE
jgi:hypothetical protein